MGAEREKDLAVEGTVCAEIGEKGILMAERENERRWGES